MREAPARLRVTAPASHASALDIAALVRAGDSIAWGGTPAEPTALLELLNAQMDWMPRASVLLGFSLTDTMDADRLRSRLQVKALGGAGTNLRFASNGFLDVLPAHYSALPELVHRGEVAVDVVLVQLAPDAGAHRLTLQADYLGDAISRARVVIAELNEQAPCTFGEPPVDPRDIDHLLPVSHPLIQWRAADGGDTARAISEQVARLVPDGATLQIGLGTLPDAVLASLSGKKDLGVHSGVIGDRIADLVDAGVITNRRKSIDAGIGVTGALLGTGCRRGGDRIRYRAPARALPFGTGQGPHRHRPSRLSRPARGVRRRPALRSPG